MTSYILDTTSVPNLSKNKPEKIIVLCHGYGGDGKDISMLALNWQRFLPETIFLCPNGPEICSVSPQGYQWFDLSSEKEEVILEKSLEGPIRQILSNAGLEASVIVNEVKSKSGNNGYDARIDKYVDMVKSGIIDPTLVTRTAVQNAASIAGLLLTTEAVITDKPEPASHGNAPAMPDMSGGMGGMGGMM